MAKREVETHVIEGLYDTDTAFKRAQQVIDNGGAELATIHDAVTGEVVGEIKPLPKSVTSKAGYSASYGSAYDAMLERRKKRESQGQKRSTDD